MNTEFNNKAVNAPACSYSKLVAYAARYAPGTQFAQEGGFPAIDGDGNPVFYSNGIRVRLDENGHPLITQPSKASICGPYNTLALAYGK